MSIPVIPAWSPPSATAATRAVRPLERKHMLTYDFVTTAEGWTIYNGTARVAANWQAGQHINTGGTLSDVLSPVLPIRVGVTYVLEATLSLTDGVTLELERTSGGNQVVSAAWTGAATVLNPSGAITGRIIIRRLAGPTIIYSVELFSRDVVADTAAKATPDYVAPVATVPGKVIPDSVPQLAPVGDQYVYLTSDYTAPGVLDMTVTVSSDAAYEAQLPGRLEWRRNNVVIAGAANPEYNLTLDDAGKKLEIRAKGITFGGLADTEDAADVLAIRIPAFATERPGISGTPEVGEVLTCAAGTWMPSSPGTSSYQWQRDGVNITDADENEYLVDAADEGKLLACVVTRSVTVDGQAVLSAPMTSEQIPILQ